MLNNNIIAKIACKDPINKKAIVGISLNGNGKYSKEQVTALIKQANKFGSYTIVLHGNDQQCQEWENENKESLKSIKNGTKICYWSTLQKQDKYQNRFVEFSDFYKNPQNSDFIEAINATVQQYIEREEKRSDNEINKADIEKFIIEEMAFLTEMAIPEQIDCFVYKGSELPAFYSTKKHFFLSANCNLFQWSELKFAPNKKLKKRHLSPQQIDNTQKKEKMKSDNFELQMNQSSLAASSQCRSFLTSCETTLRKQTDKTSSLTLSDVLCLQQKINGLFTNIFATMHSNKSTDELLNLYAELKHQFDLTTNKLSTYIPKVDLCSSNDLMDKKTLNINEFLGSDSEEFQKDLKA